MSVRKMLWPTRWKLTAALLLGALSVLLIYIVNPAYQNALFGLDLYLRVLSISASLLIVTAIYYPLSCGLLFLLKELWGAPKEGRRTEDRRRQETPSGQKGKSKRRDIIVASLLIILFNPVTFSLAYSFVLYVDYNVVNYPCGVIVYGFSNSSPAQAAGMTAGELITKVDSQGITTTESLSAVLASKSPGESVNVTTDQGTYQVRLALNPQTQRAVLGVITQSAYCQR